jgi:hypothetical protein
MPMRPSPAIRRCALGGLILLLVLLHPPRARAAPATPVVKAGAWTAAVVAVVAAGLAVKLALDASAANRDVDPYRRFPCAAGTCDVAGHPTSPLTGTEATYVSLKLGDSRRLGRMASVSALVGGAAAISSALLFWQWHWQARQAEPRTVLAPQLLARGAALTLARRW